MNVVVRQTCRLCGSRSLTPIVDLGEQLLASTFVSEAKRDHIPTRRVPLQLVRCNPHLDENACGLVQLRHTFPADIMYTDYWYLSGVNQTMRDALAQITAKTADYVELGAGDIVVDIGCNDGTLLNSYTVPKLDRVGFDPAQNFADAKDDFTRVTSYFTLEKYRAVRGDKKAKVVTSIAMFYDLEDPNTFTAEVAEILDEKGIWILQMADLPNMLRKNMFDNICHEHLCYYHLAPLEALFRRHGLKLVDLEMNYINGSSYRLYIRKELGPSPDKAARGRIAKIRFDEFNYAMDTDAPFQTFADNIQKNRTDLLAFLEKAKAEGKKVFVYGASTKGNVLLQYCGIDTRLVAFAADRNPMKWGCRTLGSDLPIISEEDARAMKPDYFLVLPYHFLDEMLVREREFIDRGGKFIVPVPTVEDPAMTAQRTALITGILGQDGSYLAEYLRARNYRVVGITRAEIDLTAPSSPDWATELIADVKPDEVYHLAACHHSSAGQDDPAQQQRMVLVNYAAALALAHGLLARGSGRLVVAGSSQMYSAQNPPARIDETTPHAPSTFYGVTKAATRDALRWLRERHGLHASTAILFNHQSPRRSPVFASRKIVQAAARISAGEQQALELRDLSSRTDWSWAPDVVAALHAMATADTPADRVVASGELHTVADLCEIAFAAVGLDWRDHVRSAKPPGDRPALVGDPRALERDGWTRTCSFAEWVAAMVKAEQP